MKITRRSSLATVAAIVARALDLAGVDAVLTGGACATIYSEGAYHSHDLDFIVQGGGTRAVVNDAMSGIGFTRDGDRYVHPQTAFFVEFPRGPLAIGADLSVSPVRLKVGESSIRALSATDACRDRLAAFYHWSDRQSLAAAVAIAKRQRVSMTTIRKWSAAEGHADRYAEFLAAVRKG